jgi:hypothetical protein
MGWKTFGICQDRLPFGEGFNVEKGSQGFPIPQPERRNNMIKLFTAKSHVDEFLGFDSVTFFWYCDNRGKAVFPYDEVIMDYEALGEAERKMVEYYVDTLLTETEVKELREYLHQVYQLQLEARRVPLPVIFEEDEWPIGTGSSAKGLFSLYKDKDYPLNSPVVGEYDLCGRFPRSTKELSSIHLEIGKMFANCLFDKMNLPVPNNLTEIIKEIYTEKSLFASKD